MKKLRKNLNKKLLFSIVLLCVIISVVSCVIGFLQYNNTIRRLYNENGYMLGSMILEQIDGDRIAEYAQTWTRDAYYSEMEDYLKEVEEASGAAYIYMAVPYENQEMHGLCASGGAHLRWAADIVLHVLLAFAEADAVKTDCPDPAECV